MSIWLLKRTDQVDYDEAAGFVVSAPSELAARMYAQEQGGRECSVLWDDDLNDWGELERFWTEPKLVPCIRLSTEPYEPEGIILRDFRAG